VGRESPGEEKKEDEHQDQGTEKGCLAVGGWLRISIAIGQLTVLAHTVIHCNTG